VFRTRAEFILRSIGMPTCNSTDERPCGSPKCITCDLFGYTGSEAGEGPVGRRGALRFRTSTITGSRTVRKTHVAIDRFTGGARRGQLFTEEVLEGAQTCLEVVVPEHHSWALPLLDWVAWDIHEGFVGVGHGTTRGLGSLRLKQSKSVRSRLTNLEESLSARRVDRNHQEGSHD
jgi:CRISPR/Cas system CSM-associated protein Csm3 (group 7 of RAMP superfamily)